MNRNERFIEIAKKCVRNEGCLGCPHSGKDDCVGLLMADAIERLEKQSAPVGCVDHESIAQSHSEEIRKLNDELCRVNVEYERTQRELYEAQKELAYLRTIKATTEAFLGVKIDGQM